jgi:hypothetical protein
MNSPALRLTRGRLLFPAETPGQWKPILAGPETGPAATEVKAFESRRPPSEDDETGYRSPGPAFPGR